jgi:hypothetical protein
VAIINHHPLTSGITVHCDRFQGTCPNTFKADVAAWMALRPTRGGRGSRRPGGSGKRSPERNQAGEVVGVGWYHICPGCMGRVGSRKSQKEQRTRTHAEIKKRMKKYR